MAINSLNASSYGLSGLVSGMDTQQMVQKMLAGTQLKIDTAGQKKTTLQYKQSLYRDVSNKLLSLQKSFLDFTSKTNLRSTSFFNTMSSTIKPPNGLSAAFSVTAGSNASVGNVSMDYIKQLATAYSEKTNVNATANVSGKLDSAAVQELLDAYGGMPGDANAVLTIKVGGQEVTIADTPTAFAGMSTSQVAAKLNEAFGSTVQAEAKVVNGKLQITATNSGDTISISGADGSDIATKMFGTSKLEGTGSLDLSVDTKAYQPSFQVNLDGRTQTVRLDLAALQEYASTNDATALKSNIQQQLYQAFGDGVKVEESNGSLVFSTSEGRKSSRFTISGDAATLNGLGLKNGVSNKLNTNMAVGELNFANGLQGTRQSFSINGVEFSYSSGTSLQTIINDINKSAAGVKVSYLEAEDRFVIQRSDTGKMEKTGSYNPIEMENTEGNLLTALFGEKGGMTVTGGAIDQSISGGTVDVNDIKDGGTFTFRVNGQNHTFKIERGEDDPEFTLETFADALNEKLDGKFGKGTVQLDVSGSGYTLSTNGAGTTVEIVVQNGESNTSLLGFAEGATTKAAGNTSLGQAGISFGAGGKIELKAGGASRELVYGVDYDDNTSLAELADKMTQKLNEMAPGASVDFDANTASFRVAGVDIPMEISLEGGAGAENVNELFGAASLAVGGEVALAPGEEYRTATNGQNAVFKLNGVEMERDSNTFTMDGLTFTLNDTTVTLKPGGDPDVESDYEYQSPTTITVSRDTEKIVEGLEEFLKLYNETIDFVNGLYRADPTYKKYAPLTQAQLDTMSDREIEKWEEKGKEGLLRSDQNLSRVLQSLRTAMYTKPTGSDIALYDLGINTSFYTNDGNFNIENRNDLIAMLESDPDAIANLFAGTGGIMDLVNDAITEAAKSSYASPGYLVSVAGINDGDQNASINKQIKQIDDQLVQLEKRYWNEYNRYWKQFNAMEQMIQQMNVQSGQLSQMLGG